jgi:hypothetical protein
VWEAKFDTHKPLGKACRPLGLVTYKTNYSTVVAETKFRTANIKPLYSASHGIMNREGQLHTMSKKTNISEEGWHTITNCTPRVSEDGYLRRAQYTGTNCTPWVTVVRYAWKGLTYLLSSYSTKGSRPGRILVFIIEGRFLRWLTPARRQHEWSQQQLYELDHNSPIQDEEAEGHRPKENHYKQSCCGCHSVPRR